MGEVATTPAYADAFADAAADFGVLGAQLWEPVSAATIARSRPQPGERVLDACCGDGASAIPTAELVGEEGRVDAVDRMQAMIDRLRERAGSALPQLHAHVGDALEWSEGDYDLVQCVLGVFFFDDPRAGAEHLVGLARPGGRVAFTIWAPGAIEPLAVALVDALRPLRPQLDDVDPTEVSPVMRSASNPGALAVWMGGLGLEQVRADAVPRTLEVTPELAWGLARGTGMRALFGDLGPRKVDEVRTAYLDLLAERGIDRLDAGTLIGVGRRPR
ncbi:class I SAM-dependent methyltransferase [Agromyces sp. SYSU T00194]|uniref:class I SAM-dependent methyltransferase n=1 Tax=Agromyces chitinivorans TaxID=3158560 RepID=UPI00339B0E5B